MKKLFTLFLLCFLCSCAPAHIWDLPYKVKYSYVANEHKYKYVYMIHNGKRCIYLYTNNEYSIGQVINFNQN